MLCRNCERQISPETRNCPHCGASRSRAAAAPKVLNNALALGAMALGAIAAIAAVSALTAPAPPPTASLRMATLQESYGGRESWGRAVSGVVWKYVTSRANIRNSPTAQGSYVVGVLSPGQRVRGVMYRGVVDANTFWFRLSDGRGYVSAVNLSDYAPGGGGGGGGGYVPPPNRGPDSRTCYVDTSSGNLRIRSYPNGPVIGGMPAGTRVRTFGEQRDGSGYVWVQITAISGRHPSGWVSREYVIC